jgi:hypothetical protein
MSTIVSFSFCLVAFLILDCFPTAAPFLVAADGFPGSFLPDAPSFGAPPEAGDRLAPSAGFGDVFFFLTGFVMDQSP